MTLVFYFRGKQQIEVVLSNELYENKPVLGDSVS